MENLPLFDATGIEILKVGIVVPDAVKTAKRYSEMFRLSPWAFYDLDHVLSVLQGDLLGHLR